MKTFKFFLVMFCISSLCNSQVTLEYTDYTFGPRDKSYFFNTENNSYHYVIANDKTNLTIKTEALAIYKVITFPLPGVLDDTMMFTDKLFNPDTLIEFIYVSIPNQSTYWQKRYRLMNENGEVLQDFGVLDYAGIIKNKNGEYKFITLNSYGEKKVYSLYGTLSADQQYLLGKNLVAFPNPADSTINISNPLESNEESVGKIFSLDGKEVKSFDVNGTTEFIEMDVTDLPIGTYLFKIKGITKKFIKK